MSLRRPGAAGPVTWMAKNPVAANLLMAMFILGGFVMSRGIKQEVFPALELDMVIITMAYPGASPAEVESGLLKVIEEAVRPLDQVKRVTSDALEGVGAVRVELELGAKQDRALSDVKSAVDRIRSFPLDAERPVVSLAIAKRDVITVVIYGDADEATLRALAERTRDDLLAEKTITQAELSGARPPEIAVEVPQAQLRAHGLTLGRIAETVRRSSLELPAGGIRTASGEVLLRTAERRDHGHQFEDITVVSGAMGGRVRLGDIADVKDGFLETDQSAWFNGQRAMMVKVFRVGDQTPIEIAAAVHEHIDAASETLPAGVQMGFWNDQSEMFRDRMDLLLRNGWIGLSLVLLTLGLFLEVRLAMWVAVGMVISFLGAMVLIAPTGLSINMVSLFAFIVTLGIVVDDAIVVGEAVFARRQAGATPMRAAIDGALEVAHPVTFSILTTIAAFTPLLFVPGVMGQIFRNIPIVVISVLTVSLVESLFVLPSHLGHMRKRTGKPGPIRARQQAFSRGVERFIERVYQPSLRVALQNRALTLSIMMAFLLTTIGIVRGGHLEFTFLPKIDVDVVKASARLPYGAPIEDTRKIHETLIRAAEEVMTEGGDEGRVARGMLSVMGGTLRSRMRATGGGASAGSHLTEVAVSLARPEIRQIGPREFAKRWRERVGELVGVEHLAFRFNRAHGAGAAIDVQLSHSNVGILKSAAAELGGALRTFDGVVEIDEGFSEGKPQLDIKLRPEARNLGLTEGDVARQVRSAFYGAEALRQQRGRDEIRVVVRLPEQDRRREHSFESLLLRTPTGGEVPLSRVATVTRGRAADAIHREDGRRVVSVTGDVVAGVANAAKVIGALEETELPRLLAAHSGLRYSLEGEMRERRESLAALGKNYLLAMVVIFALLAVPFKSYIQPLIVMSSIPFGLVGAAAGHLLFGYDLSIISMMGVVALSGIVVNDALVLIVAVNRLRADGLSAEEAVVQGAVRRFRPIILTSLTTFFGLAPMIFETAMAARFLIPMALSLGFGVLFGTAVILVQIPTLYLVAEDARELFFGPRTLHDEDEGLASAEPAG